MPTDLWIELPPLPAPLAITLPGGVTIEQLHLLQVVQPALTPLVPLFDLVDTVVAVFACIKAIPDALGPPPDPTGLVASIGALSEKVSKLLRLVPQLSLPITILGILDLVLDELQKARGQLVQLQAQLLQILAAVDRARELEDASLLAITHAAQENVAQEAANVGRSLASLGKLIDLLNLFLGMVGGPTAPDLTDLAGRPLDDVVPAIDTLIALLRSVRAAVPVP